MPRRASTLPWRDVFRSVERPHCPPARASSRGRTVQRGADPIAFLQASQSVRETRSSSDGNTTVAGTPGRSLQFEQVIDRPRMPEIKEYEPPTDCAVGHASTRRDGDRVHRDPATVRTGGRRIGCTPPCRVTRPLGPPSPALASQPRGPRCIRDSARSLTSSQTVMIVCGEGRTATVPGTGRRSWQVQRSSNHHEQSTSLR